MYSSLPTAPMSRMAPSTALHRGMQLGPVALALLGVVAAGWLIRVTWADNPAREFRLVDTQSSAHRHDDRHDWLVAAEPARNRLVVYDASDGRPLQSLPAAGVQRIVRQGDRLYVRGAPGSSARVTNLPSRAWRRLP